MALRSLASFVGAPTFRLQHLRTAPLYQAKQGGRSRVVLAEPDLGTVLAA